MCDDYELWLLWILKKMGIVFLLEKKVNEDCIKWEKFECELCKLEYSLNVIVLFYYIVVVYYRKMEIKFYFVFVFIGVLGSIFSVVIKLLWKSMVIIYFCFVLILVVFFIILFFFIVVVYVL